MASPRRVPFHVSLMSVILGFVAVAAVVTLVLVIAVADRSVDATADQLFTAAGELAGERTASRFRSAADLAMTGARIGELTAPVQDPLEHPARPFFLESLQWNEDLYSVYIGRESGEFFQVINTRGNPRILEEHDAPEGTVFLLRTIATASSEERIETWAFVGADGTGSTGTHRTIEGEYDPRMRPWYRAAVARSDRGVSLSEPYLFHSLGAPGITLSRTLIDGTGVFGVDMTLESLQEFALTQQISPHGGILVADPAGRIVASHPALATLFDGTGTDDAEGARIGTAFPRLPDVVQDLPADTGHRIAEEGWIALRREISTVDGAPWTVVAAAPVDDFLAPFRMIRTRIVWATILLLLAAIPVVLLLARSMTRVLTALAGEAARVRDLDFAGTGPVQSSIIEFHRLGLGFHAMKERLRSRTRDLNASLDRLSKIIDLNIAISAEQNIDRLSELILQGARELAHADGGSLYLINNEAHTLEFVIVLNDSLGFAQGGTSGSPVTLPSVPLFDVEGNPNEHNVVSHTVHHEQTVNIADAYNAGGFDFSGTRRFDEANGYRTQSILTVPLKPRGSDIIGAIQLLNAKDPDTGETTTFSVEIQRFVEALSAGAATALYNRDLIEEQKRLFDAMIQLIAGAIDAKSPYTGGHCARVPEIALMLAAEAERSGKGTLQAFHFNGDSDLRAFRIGAWLHDAGKVTTPDYVVDKATKLETIYNRIHEIRTRFEVLLRDARIERHEAVLAGADPGTEDARLARTEAELHEEYAFIAECNLGGEYMAPEHLERLKEIARRRWMRHFDDSIGLSWSEQQRRNETGPVTLPVEEHLLADKEEHIIPRTDDFYRQYERFGFTIPVPEHLYNLGEVYNLSVGRGTLTAEERFKINEHVMQTILMLDRLPFPRALENVPEYAGTHHETLDGSGYPRQLTEESLSIPARIMAIADIFEALTASDRPYKKAKPLSVAIGILAKFKEEGHIDPELFDLFLESGVYRKYAERHLRPEQVDEVDISRYVG
ncbi:MAG: HD domain-containing phosphohydrolase [Alkalispirochaeta sp.]